MRAAIVEILNETSCEAEEAVIVEDSASDMRIGRNVKVKTCIGVLTGAHHKRNLKRLLI